MACADQIQIYLNENPHKVAIGSRIETLLPADQKPAVLLCNGRPATPNKALRAGDRIVTWQNPPCSRHLQDILERRQGQEQTRKLQQASITIAGAGGLGSHAAIALARCGVGRLQLIDHDYVEPSNLHRQQFFVDQVGHPKVEALTATLRRIHPHMHIESCIAELTPDNTATLIQQADAVIEALDAAASKAMLVQQLRKHRPQLPIIAASGVAGLTPGSWIQCRQVQTNLFIVGDEQTGLEAGGLFAPRVGLVGHYQALLAVQLILGLCPTQAPMKETAHGTDSS